MYDYAVMGEWLSFAVRWLHVITAIAWIGSSFYFIALDLSLRKAPDLPPGAAGEEWQVHGGGFYHIRKFLVAPEAMPEHLTWFKWESYATWLSGFALLVLVYYGGASLYLVDPNVFDIPVWAAILISLASLAVGLGLYAGVHGPRSVPASGRVHRDDHDGECVSHHYAEPADRCRRFEGGTHAGPEIWADRQATLDPQQLSDPASHLSDAVEPQPVGLCHRV
jgi:hypothetical protein